MKYSWRNGAIFRVGQTFMLRQMSTLQLHGGHLPMVPFWSTNSISQHPYHYQLYYTLQFFSVNFQRDLVAQTQQLIHKTINLQDSCCYWPWSLRAVDQTQTLCDGCNWSLCRTSCIFHCSILHLHCKEKTHILTG